MTEPTTVAVSGRRGSFVPPPPSRGGDQAVRAPHCVAGVLDHRRERPVGQGLARRQAHGGGEQDPVVHPHVGQLGVGDAGRNRGTGSGPTASRAPRRGGPGQRGSRAPFEAEPGPRLGRCARRDCRAGQRGHPDRGAGLVDERQPCPGSGAEGVRLTDGTVTQERKRGSGKLPADGCRSARANAAVTTPTADAVEDDPRDDGDQQGPPAVTRRARPRPAVTEDAECPLPPARGRSCRRGAGCRLPAGRRRAHRRRRGPPRSPERPVVSAPLTPGRPPNWSPRKCVAAAGMSDPSSSLATASCERCASCLSTSPIISQSSLSSSAGQWTTSPRSMALLGPRRDHDDRAALRVAGSPRARRCRG